MKKEFIHKIRIYYEDTDSGGVVYYANYLKFLERARTEAIYSFGLTNNTLREKYGTLIIVKSCKIDYLKPSKFEDKLTISSKLKEISKTSFVMEQNIYRDKELITKAEVHLVTVNENAKPIKIPEILEKNLKETI